MSELIPWETFSDFLSFGDGPSRGFNGFWQPSVDVSERPDFFIVRANLPGMNRDNVKLIMDEHALVIKGESGKEETDQGEHYYRRERRFGSFVRRIPFHGRIKEDQIRASFKDGVLEVLLPKAEGKTGQGRRIEIQ